MITELEEAEPPEGPGEPGDLPRADVVSAAPTRASLGSVFRTPRGRPWGWVLGAVVATSAAWALTLQATGYGDAATPDLHHYRLTDSPCTGDDLKPLTDALGVDRTAANPAEMRTGTTLDQAQCLLTAEGTVGDHWQSTYTVLVTVELHKKTDPRPEFEDRNRPHGPNLDPASVTAATDDTDHVSLVPGLGDLAYLLAGDDSHQTLTVLHGGAVFTVTVDADTQWTGAGGVPPDANGYPQQPPGLIRLQPALIATVRQVMSRLSQ